MVNFRILFKKGFVIAMNNSKKLQFKNGKFKIMQITDTQDTQRTATDTVRLIEAALDSEKPDLVVFTGDQVKGYGFNLRLGNPAENIRKTIDKICAPIEKRGIPFAATFGNHDRIAACDKKKQIEYYTSYSSCVNDTSNDFLPGGATFNLPIFSENGEKMLFNLYIIDSLEKAPDGGYAAVSKEQIDWTAEKCEELKKANGGEKVPSLVFQHIPVPEMHRLLKKVTKDTPGAVKGNKGFPDYYVIDEKWAKEGSYMRESIACPYKTSGQFDGWVKQGDIIGAYFGHDHINCFNGTADGIDMGYTPGAGFNVYGPGTDRAVRVFEISEETPEKYETRVITYRELLGKRITNPFKYWIYTHAPSSVDAAKPMIAKGVAAAAVLAAVIAIIVKFL